MLKTRLSDICTVRQRIKEARVKLSEYANNKIQDKNMTRKATCVLWTTTQDILEVDRLERKTAKAVITRLKRHFSNHGIPNIFQSDHGPPFDAQEFREFAASYEFELVTS